MAVENKRLDLELCREVAESCAAIKLRRTSRVVGRRYSQQRLSSGLTGAQFSLLIAVALTGSPNVTLLTEILELDQTTLSRTLRTMSKQGLVTISAGTDRRTRTIRMTETGESGLIIALGHWKQTQAKLVSQFGAERWRRLSRELGDLQSIFREP